MPSVEEIAYQEAERALEGQAADLENIRSHINIALTAEALASPSSPRSILVVAMPSSSAPRRSPLSRS